MSLVFSTQFNKGSYIDRVSKTAGTNTNGVFKRTEKGLAWEGNGSSSGITLSSPITVSRNATTIEIWFKGWDVTIDRCLVGTGNSSQYISIVNRGRVKSLF